MGEYSHWPADINQQEFIDDSYKLTGIEMSRKYGRTERNIRHMKQYLRDRGIDAGSGMFPEASGQRYDKEMQISHDRVLILGDAEIPDHDADVFDLAVAMGNRFELDHLIINGDLVALDCFSTWARDFARKRNYKDELEPTREVLKEFLKHFKKVYMVNSNHARRLQRLTEGQMWFGDQISDIVGVECSEYSHGYLYSAGEKICFCHQENYSRVPLSVPRALVQNELCHMACAHTHRLAFGWDNSNSYWLVETGHCRSVQHTAYKNLRMTSHPRWNQGFVMVIDGYPYIVDMRTADFWLSVKPDRASEMAEQAKAEMQDTSPPRKWIDPEYPSHNERMTPGHITAKDFGVD